MSQNDIKNMSFEKAMAELENIVSRLESGEQQLDKSIEDYTKGDALRKHCDKKLAEAKLKVEKIVVNGETTSTQPFDDA